jgi:hypothetical protein
LNSFEDFGLTQPAMAYAMGKRIQPAIEARSARMVVL